MILQINTQLQDLKTVIEPFAVTPTKSMISTPYKKKASELGSPGPYKYKKKKMTREEKKQESIAEIHKFYSR